MARPLYQLLILLYGQYFLMSAIKNVDAGLRGYSSGGEDLDLGDKFGAIEPSRYDATSLLKDSDLTVSSDLSRRDAADLVSCPPPEMALILDRSASIGVYNWVNSMLLAAHKLIDSSSGGGIFTFADISVSEADLGTSKTNLLKVIESLKTRSLGSTTLLNPALLKLQAQYAKLTPTAKKNHIATLLTDGMAVDKDAAAKTALSLRNDGLKMLCINVKSPYSGVNATATTEYLEQLCTKEYVFEASDFTKLQKVVEEISKTLCNIIAPPIPSTSSPSPAPTLGSIPQLPEDEDPIAFAWFALLALGPVIAALAKRKYDQQQQPQDLEDAKHKTELDGIKAPTVGRMYNIGGLGTMSGVSYKKAATDDTLRVRNDEERDRNTRTKAEAEARINDLLNEGYSSNPASIFTTASTPSVKQGVARSAPKSTTIKKSFVDSMLLNVHLDDDSSEAKKRGCSRYIEECAKKFCELRQQDKKAKKGTMTPFSSKEQTQNPKKKPNDSLAASSGAEVTFSSGVSAFSSKNKIPIQTRDDKVTASGKTVTSKKTMTDSTKSAMSSPKTTVSSTPTISGRAQHVPGGSSQLIASRTSSTKFKDPETDIKKNQGSVKPIRHDKISETSSKKSAAPILPSNPVMQDMQHKLGIPTGTIKERMSAFEPKKAPPKR